MKVYQAPRDVDQIGIKDIKISKRDYEIDMNEIDGGFVMSIYDDRLQEKDRAVPICKIILQEGKMSIIQKGEGKLAWHLKKS